MAAGLELLPHPLLGTIRRPLTIEDGHFKANLYKMAINRLTDNLKKTLGEPAARIYGPQGRGQGDRLEHALMLPAHAVRLVRAVDAR